MRGKFWILFQKVCPEPYKETNKCNKGNEFF